VIHRAAIDALRDGKAARTEAGESDDELVGPRPDGLAWLGDGTTAEPDEAGAGATVSIEAAGPEELDDDLLRRIRDV
jgi:hypothetical protein